jgi:hypothetical protein
MEKVKIVREAEIVRELAAFDLSKDIEKVKITAVDSVVKNELLDPVPLRQQAKYKTGGLTVTSNNTSIIPRDGAGNIILRENEQNNPLLIIEPVDTTILLESVLKVLDTRFEYFKFPVSTKEVAEQELPSIELQDEPLVIEYTFPISYDSQNQPIEFLRINTTDETTWFYNDGTISNGFKQLPFTGGNQTKRNGYMLTQDVIDTLKSKNKTLKFTIQTQVAYKTDNSTTLIRLQRENVKVWRIWEYPEINAIAQTTNPAPVLSMEYVLNINDLIADDFYVVEAVSTAQTNLYVDSAYWTIEEIDIPKTQSLSNNTGYGVYTATGEQLRIVKSYVDPGQNPEVLKISLKEPTIVQVLDKTTRPDLESFPSFLNLDSNPNE